MKESTQTLLHTCAQAATANETRFRVQYPNSRPRASRIIALDDEAARVMSSITEEPWKGAQFFAVSAGRESDLSQTEGEDLTVADLQGEGRMLSSVLEGADVIVMLLTTTAGRDACEIIGAMARRRAIMTAGLVISTGERTGVDDDVIQALRPFASVLVVATDADYVPAMLTALRA